ncbi:septum site-determining protein MinC [Sansalvadorimonas sp. 2012CJ34-2]|uniref:Probable septum site-determining protein MinC n=1 Tax=Parendozoicomonas callyspongiae TaxID=2942213 RepID=A0ABT0PE08_9GAMM|nr:septum site-determining protein MinC [Sansalvadorimonas sp. 2012CJ34-2]MCL6269612.1 septum site-determining protein MinC [Sansalvadorimonas sp. 2012CJ34-2]
MTSTITPHTASPCFQLKGSMVTMMTLELYQFDEISLHQQLQGLVAKAPRFFENTPVVVGLERLAQPNSLIDMARLCTLCAGFGINLIAVRGGSSAQRKSAIDAGLACLAAQPQAVARKIPKQDHSDTPQGASVTPIHQSSLVLEPHNKNNSEPGAPEQEVKEQEQTENPDNLLKPPRIISSPVRSGQQIYHEGDLILTGPVSAGAEILAEGYIHAYGPFRGRALAGVKGNKDACIFCTHNEAELVSINGHYKLAANINKSLWKKPVRIYLEDDALIIQPL